MSQIQRYHIVGGFQIEHDTGKFCEWADHERDVSARVAAAVQAECERCRREEVESLRTALIRICDDEYNSGTCPSCEGSGAIYADGQAHHYGEIVPCLPCDECGGTGRIQPRSADEIAADALAAVRAAQGAEQKETTP